MLSGTLTVRHLRTGDIVYLSLAGAGVIIVNSLEVAQELAAKRLRIYSARPNKMMTTKLMYSEFTLLMSQPGEGFTEQRKVFRQALGPRVVGQYDGLIQQHFDSFTGSLSEVSGDPFPAIVE